MKCIRMYPRLVLVSILVCLTGQTQEPADNLDIDACAEKIRAYESLFTRVHVKWASKGSAEPTSKGLYADQTADLYVDGLRKRLTRSANYRAGGIYGGVYVTDGKVYKALSYRKPDAGDGVIAPASDSTDASFQLEMITPHAARKFLEVFSKSVVSSENGITKIRYQASPPSTMYIDAEYLEWGPYLIVQIYEYFTMKDGKPRPGSVYKFEYTLPERPEDAGAKPIPKRWEQISKLHGVHDTYDIVEVDFDPQVTDDMFTMEFPAGTWVRDKFTGTSSRIPASSSAAKEPDARPNEATVSAD